MYINIKTLAFGRTSARPAKWTLNEAAAFAAEIKFDRTAKQAADKADPICGCGMLLGSVGEISPKVTAIVCECGAEHEIHA